MKFTIRHEIRGRIRVHFETSRMSCRQADILAYYLENLPGVQQVKVYERTADAAVCYTGDRGALLQALRSPNWYVRYNASASLEAHGLQYEDMLAVLHGDDRYAREMLTYRIQSRDLEALAAARPAYREEVAAGA